MHIGSGGGRRAGIAALSLAAGLFVVFGLETGRAQTDDRAPVPLETSVNAVMVALVDHAAHVIWEQGSKASLTGRDWQVVEQHAIQLIAAGTLVSLGGSGPEDSVWSQDPAWQRWSLALREGGRAALAAANGADRPALQAAGEQIVDACFGCHDRFKPDAPTEGLMHIPHYEN